MNFTDEITRQLHEGGPQTELEWQLGWSRTILKTCGLMDNPDPGFWVLTDAGSRQTWMDAREVKACTGNISTGGANASNSDRRRAGGCPQPCLQSYQGHLV